MPISSLDIKGFKGFSTEQTLRLAQPSGKLGSGITVLVGPNNGGKTSILEALHTISNSSTIPTTFEQRERNMLAGDLVEIRVRSDIGAIVELKTNAAGKELTVRSEEGAIFPLRCYGLSSRRFFPPTFEADTLQTMNRQYYQSMINVRRPRNDPVNGFSQNRLFLAASKGEEFNAILRRVIDVGLDWGIIRSDIGGFNLRPEKSDSHQDSDGLGSGIISLFFIVDALYDSLPGELILIDEPELSLHPMYQRRLSRLLAEYAKERQIVLATHSPYFIDLEYIGNGAQVARIHVEEGGSKISQLTCESAAQLKGFTENRNNPHIFGLSARETFFQNDGVILLEGQEDVVHYPRILAHFEETGQLTSVQAAIFEERFFGWGAGGASNIEKIVPVLSDLGFSRVIAIFDKDQKERIKDLEANYPDYRFGYIPADDVRTKEKRKQKAVQGLLDEDYQVRKKYESKSLSLFKEMYQYLQSKPGEG